jgi:hypothetical protein
MLALSCAGVPSSAKPKAESAPVVASAFVPVLAPPTAAAVPTDFEVALVDDSARLAALEHSLEAPAGVSWGDEVLYTRDGEVLRPRFVRLSLQEGESLDQALKRIAAWLAPLELPANERLVWGPLFEPDADEQERLVGYRSYVLFPPSIVAKDVIEASVDDQSDFPGARLRFAPPAAAHFQAITRDHRKERMAIVIQGLVQSAPVIQSEISGGHVMVTTGGASMEQQRARAEELVRLLKAQPGAK